MRSAKAGPSQPSVRPSSQQRLLSSDFGDFTSAPSLNRNLELSLDETDLLGSFEDVTSLKPVEQSFRNGSSLRQPDLLGEEIWDDGVVVTTSHDPHPNGQPAKSAPIHVTLPPRPSEISPNYVPHTLPRRMSHGFPGPGSPPLLSTSGNDIVFHPSHQYHDGAADGMRRLRQQSDGQSPTKSQRSPRTSLDDHAHPSFLNTLATTTKLASKWKTAVNPSTFLPPSSFDNDILPGTASPIDVTHTTPFASAEQVAGSYIPPSGAPSFRSLHGKMKAPTEADGQYPRLTLLGRRDTTAPVLTDSDAEELRNCLPPRQRLANAWTLLFSLDQHGASLASLYRLVEKSVTAFPGTGNLLVVRDADGHKFGIYMNEAIVKREGTYYGSGESFMFKLIIGTQPKIFRWTGKNHYFALCESSFISFGGGGPSYGLLLDASFSQNSTSTSPTYDNEVLSEAGSAFSTRATPFECLGLEVWSTS